MGVAVIGAHFKSAMVLHSNSWRRIAICAVLTAALYLPSAGAQQDERAVRAAFLFNLTKYVSWPSPHEHLVICVVGSEDIGRVLKQILDGKRSDGRAMEVILRSPDADLNDCDELYLSDVSPATVRAILNRTASRSVLTVSDSERFVRSGGMVALVRSGDQIQIEVNLAELRKRQLTMSSRLLRIAIITPADGGAQ